MAGRRRAFEFFLRATRRVIAREHGEAYADAVLADARGEYERVRPEVPGIGGRANVFQPVMTVNGWIVALHRALRRRGHGPEKVIAVSHEVFDAWIRRLPHALRHGLGRLLLSGPALRYFESQARRSQERRHAEDFVWHVEKGADGEMAMVFEECAVNKWYDAQDVRELRPFCNFADVTYSRLMGMGIDASKTIGLGCEHCELRFKRGRETVVPASLRGIIAAEGDPAATTRSA
jgi:hypothetical protein